MPTMTLDQEIASEVSPELWRAYRQARAAHPERVASYAAGLALAEHGITTERDRWERLLVKKEFAQGLRPSRHEREQDAEADRAQREAELAAIEPDSPEAIRRDALSLATKLEQDRERLLPAFADPAVRAEIESIDGQLAQARQTAELVTEAESAKVKEEEKAAEQAARAAQESARERACEMEPGMAKRRAAIDKHLAAAAAETRLLADEQQTHCGHLAVGGMEPFNLRAFAFRSDAIESAMGFHFQGTGVLRGRPGRNYPLVRAEVK